MRTVVDVMTETMINDVTNPPLATRFFAYAMLAGYEIAQQHDSSLQSMHRVLKDFPALQASQVQGYDWQLAAILAIYETAAGTQPSGERIRKAADSLLALCRQNGISDEVIQASEEYAREVSKQVLSYAKSDGYRKISQFKRYVPIVSESTWYPTPPGYFPAVEPYFNIVRPFFLDSASQFKPEPPIVFSKDKSSAFYQLSEAVYLAGVKQTEEEKAIAGFWDCNPFALIDEGHLQIGAKKISPGAHWMGIAGQVCQQQKTGFAKSVAVHTFLAMTMMDAFICCWDEKYRSNRIRPETAIRKLIDPDWKPLLQTPPFPEYTSGHSVISSAAAELLSQYLGDNTSFIDSTEIPFGLPPRRFLSFRQAAEEAAISRLYGGIHFLDAIQRGQDQGKRVGLHVLGKMDRTFAQ